MGDGKINEVDRVVLPNCTADVRLGLLEWSTPMVVGCTKDRMRQITAHFTTTPPTNLAAKTLCHRGVLLPYAGWLSTTELRTCLKAVAHDNVTLFFQEKYKLDAATQNYYFHFDIENVVKEYPSGYKVSYTLYIMQK